MAYTDQIPDLGFLDLYDAPNEFSGHGLFSVVVNASENALEFVEYVAANRLLGKVVFGTPTDNQILVFNTVSDRWEPQDHSHTQFVYRAGDTMTGFLTLYADPTAPLHAATKQYVDAIENEQGDQNQATKEPTGFQNTNQDSAYSFTNATRVFSIWPDPGPTYTIWHWGEKILKSGTDSVTIPDSPGLHVIYFDAYGVLRSSQSITLEEALSEVVVVSYVYWSSQDQMALYVADERHGLMPWQMHLRYHRDSGSSYVSGMNLDDFTPDGNGNLDIHAQFSVTAGIFDDEDMRHSVPDEPFPAEIPVLYLSGSPGYWRRQAPRTSPVINYGGTGRVARMGVTGTTWTLEEIKNNAYFLIHIFSTNDPTMPYCVVAPLQSFDNPGKAESEAEADLQSTMLLPDFPPAEYIPMATIICQTSSAAANQFKMRIVSVPSTGNPFIDWRGRPLNPQAAISHYGLIDRDLDGQHPATAIYTDISGFNGNLIGVDNDVQAALDRLDDLEIAGEINTASALGTGAPVFKGKANKDLQFYNIKSGDPTLQVTLDGVSNDIVLTHTNYIFHAYNAAGGVSLTSTQWSALTWTDEVRKDSIYTHQNNSAEITFTSPGDYLITVDITTEVTVDDRTTAVFRMTLDGVEIPGTRAMNYQRLVADPGTNSVITRFITVTAGQVLKVEGYSNRSSSGVRTLADGCRIYIEKK